MTMTRPIRYKQCRLERREGTARIERMSWLPEKYAVAGSVVRLRDNGTWTDGWKILSSSGPSLDEKYVVNLSHAHTRQRRASDI
jgi:hypothetical protein